MKSGVTYFLIVFCAGFVLGIARVLLLVPRFGERMAEFLEIPVMIVVIFFTAGLVVSRFEFRTFLPAFVTGLMGLCFLIIAEVLLILALRGLSVREYIETRDPYSFSAYLVSLIIFALMPAILVFWKFERNG